MQPQLASNRLVLRPFHIADAPEVRRLAGDRVVAEPTAAIPHPYPEGAAEAWIRSHAELFATKKGVSYAITLPSLSALLGTVSLLDISERHLRAEVGYWVGREYWAHGYCTEALTALLQFAEGYFGATRFVGRCLASNHGSARVLEKCGFIAEGRQIKHVHHRGGYEDMLLFGRCWQAR